MKCIDELCKSKGIYNSTNKQIIITVQHTIIYEDHCFLKPNFGGGEELNLEIFDFIKDSPEITGIEILKSKEKYSKINNEVNKAKNKNIFVKDKNKNIDYSSKNQDEDNLDKLIDEENINMNEVENIINEDDRNNEEEPIFQNRIVNNITQIIQNKNKDKVKNDGKKSDKFKHIKENNIKENFTLININYEDINNNYNFYYNSYIEKRSRSRRMNKNNNRNYINDEIKIEEIEQNNYDNKNVKKEGITDENKENKYNIKNEDIADENKENNDNIKKEDTKDEMKEDKLEENKENKLEENKENELEENKENKLEENNSNSNIKNNNNNIEKEKENLDVSYNYIEFNIDKIKRLEGTEKSYSKKVYEINVQNKKKVEEERRLSKSKKAIRKSEEGFNGRYPRSRSRSRSRSPSYLILNENRNDKESENELVDIYSESAISQLSVISHFENKKIEVKIIIDENDSLFSFDLLNRKEREKCNKRLNDETIFLSDDSDKRKRLERFQKKYGEKHLK